MSFVADQPTGRCEVLGTFITGVVLSRLQGCPVGGCLRSSPAHRDQSRIEPARSGLRQEFLNCSFRFRVFALAELAISKVPSCIGKIKGRPIFVFEGAPYL